jgi:choline kinase
VPGLVKFAIEIQGKNIIYHPVENLQPIRYGDDKEIEF